MERVTIADLEAVCRRINRMVNSTDQQEVWTRTEDGLRANIGVFYIDGAYGGVALYRVMNEHGGVTDVLNVGHVPKRELQRLMFAFIEGMSTEWKVMVQS